MAANISQITTVTAQSFHLFVLTINRMLASTVFKKTKGAGSAYNNALKTTPFGRSDAFTRGGFAIMPHVPAPVIEKFSAICSKSFRNFVKSALAKNVVIEEVLALEDESVSTVLLQSCDVEIANANNDELRNKSKTKKLLQVKAANNVYYAPSIALFERDQGNCELVIKGLLYK